MKKVAAVLACLCVIALSAGSASAARDHKRTTAARVGTIDWGRCRDGFLRKLGARCAMLSVPLDYAHPAGSHIRLAISRIRHTVPDAQYQGVMLMNPGGPGGSGLWMSILGQFIPNDAGAAYDWIGFDPRGVGSSKPALSCIAKYFHGDRPWYVPKSAKLETTWKARSKKYADACAAAQPELLPHMTTVDAARDMDSIRQALGVGELNYYGFSYGTYLGQVYATMFPGSIRRAVFDGVVDPRDVWHQANLSQDPAFDRNVHIFFAWIAKHNRAYHLGRTRGRVSRRYADALRALKRRPAGDVVGPDEWNDIFLYAGYTQALWKYIARVFASWVHDQDARMLIRAYRRFDAPGYDNGYAVYLAVECTDAAWPDWTTYSSDVWAAYDEAPFMSWNNGWFNAPCLFWNAPAGTPVDVTGGSTPVLLINETLDAATPYDGAVYVRSVFPDSALIAVVGGVNHANSLAGNKCVDNRIADFLATGTLPPRQPGDVADVECQPLPAPRPSAERATSHSLVARPLVPVSPIKTR